MATAKKLPSGSWRVRVFDYTDAAGKKHYKSFTCDDTSAKGKRKCEAMAAEWAVEKEDRKKGKQPVLLEDAWENYINSRKNVLSPATVREYKTTKKNSFKNLMNKDIYSITQEDIQKAVDEEAENVSPKTVRNKHGLLSAVLKMYRPEFAINTRLPQKKKPALYIPTDDDVKKLMASVNDDQDMLIAILLAAFGPMRRSEICALRTSDIKNGVAHVQRAIVLNDNREWVEKNTKSVAGDRFIPLPDFVLSQINFKNEMVVNLHPNNITDRFEWILKRSGLPHFRFHDLRHYCASIQHAMGIPDAYIMQRGGWGSDAVLKNVYRHALSDKEDEMYHKANDYFSSMYDTKYDTK